MTAEIYRKRGRAVRWENGWLVRVVEHGEAIEDGATFRCHPLPHETMNLDAGNVERVARELKDLRFERLIISEGFAEHEFADRRWSDTTRRIHAALVKDRLRALIDLASFEIDEILHIASALDRAQSEREAPSHLRLAPNVSAAILPWLKDVTQVAEGIDGKGQPIRETVGENWYRPSYRVRPVRMPMNLRARPTTPPIDADLPIAIALLAPADGLALRVLIEDRDAVYPATVRITRIAAVASEVAFYPYGAGSFGAEMML